MPNQNFRSVEAVMAALERAERTSSFPVRSISNVERLADQFADIKPVPYNVPIERFAGMAFEKRD